MRQGVVQVEEVQLEVLHRLEAVERVLEEGARVERSCRKLALLTVWRCLTLDERRRNLTCFNPAKAKESTILMGLSLITNIEICSEPAKA